MRKNGKYRFSLQFPAKTEEQIQAGELLERLGNRKSAVVVAALGEYLAAHPVLLSPECKVEIRTEQPLSPDFIKEIVKKMLDERLVGAEDRATANDKAKKGDNNITEHGYPF